MSIIQIRATNTLLPNWFYDKISHDHFDWYSLEDMSCWPSYFPGLVLCTEGDRKEEILFDDPILSMVSTVPETLIQLLLEFCTSDPKES